MRGRKLEVSVERKQDHENQPESEGNNEIHLRPGFEELAVFAAPRHLVALWQSHGFVHCGLAVAHRPLQVTAFDAVLHPDVAGVIFPINK